MAERGKLYLWPRNRSFGDSKARPVVVIAPEAATRHGRRWVVLPISTEAELTTNLWAYPLAPSQSNGLRQPGFVMTWLPTTVPADQLLGPLGRLSATEVAAISAALIQALDLASQQPWQIDGRTSARRWGQHGVSEPRGRLRSAARTIQRPLPRPIPDSPMPAAARSESPQADGWSRSCREAPAVRQPQV